MGFQSKVFNTKYKIGRLIKLANTHRYSAPRLVKIFNCDRKSIFRALRARNIVLPNLGRFRKRIYCNERFFINLSPISAYWAGFIAADGTLFNRDKSVTIALSKRDVRHLYKFIKAIKSNVQVGYTESNNSTHVSICSNPLYESLIKLGITPNKSLSITHVNIPLSLKSHFIRGVFDGDGSISGEKITHVQFCIAGNKPFLQEIQNSLVRKCNINRVKLYSLPPSGRAYKLQYTGSQIFKILDFLYKKSCHQTRLDRKYQKMLELKKKFKINGEIRN